MIYTKYYRVVYSKEKEMFKPQVGFRWRWLKFLPFTSWYYLYTDRDSTYCWKSSDNYGQQLWSPDMAIAEKNMLMVKNHYDGLDDADRELKQSVKEFNKNKKHKVKII